MCAEEHSQKSGNYPPIEKLLPQQAPMVLLDEIEHHEEKRITCLLTAGRVRVPLNSSGNVPVWVSLEYMAQSLAALAGIRAMDKKEKPRPGVILASRRFESRVPAFSLGQILRVDAEILSDSEDLSVFNCVISDAKNNTELVSASLSVYKPKNLLNYYRHKESRA